MEEITQTYHSSNLKKILAEKVINNGELEFYSDYSNDVLQLRSTDQNLESSIQSFLNDLPNDYFYMMHSTPSVIKINPIIGAAWNVHSSGSSQNNQKLSGGR